MSVDVHVRSVVPGLVLAMASTWASGAAGPAEFRDAERLGDPQVSASQTTVGVSGGIYVPQMAACDSLVTSFLNTYGIPGATFALTKDGKLVYLRSFGDADLDQTEPTQPYHLFRLASVSKPITSIAIMHMVENGLIDLDDTVFGAGGLLENHAYFSTVTITDTRIYDITVQDLLEHAAGWDRSVDCFPNPTTPYPWWYSGCEPILAPLHVTQTLGESNPATEEALVRFVMEKGLNFTPGTGYAYSNMGFNVLGEIIEEVSGQSYEDYVKTEILSPLGICDMHIAKNLLEDKYEREAEYADPSCQTLSCYGTGEMVPCQYGGLNMEAMDAHGGWVATARELTRLLVAVDGFATKPDILSPSTLTTMSTPSANNSYYALGWSVNPLDNWWHFGSLPGTATFVARTSIGFNWAILLNKVDFGQFEIDFDALPWDCLNSTFSYPSYDLMLVPSQNASGLSFSAIDETSATVSWTNGDGDERILIASEGAPVSDYPLDGTSYTANAVFGAGDALGNGRVLYSGSGGSVAVSGLTKGTTYHFRLFEYNQNAATGTYPLYMLCNGPVEEMTTTCTDSTWYLDDDGDGFGDPGASVVACHAPEGYVPDGSDCADDDDQVWAIPGEVTGLKLLKNTPTSAVLTWTAPAEPGGETSLYDAMKAETATFDTFSCIKDGTAGNFTIDGETPTPRSFYLIRSGNVCGPGTPGDGRVLAGCP